MAEDLPGNGWKWKWSFCLLNIGMVGMTVSLLISGYVQSQVERAIGGSTWAGYFSAQAHPWFIQGMVWREVFGVVFFFGFVILVWNLLTIGKTETRKAEPNLIGRINYFCYRLVIFTSKFRTLDYTCS